MRTFYPKRHVLSFVRTELGDLNADGNAGNHPYINAKIWQFWIGYSTAYLYQGPVLTQCVGEPLLDTKHTIEQLLKVFHSSSTPTQV